MVVRSGADTAGSVRRWYYAGNTESPATAAGRLRLGADWGDAGDAAPLKGKVAGAGAGVLVVYRQISGKWAALSRSRSWIKLWPPLLRYFHVSQNASSSGSAGGSGALPWASNLKEG